MGQCLRCGITVAEQGRCCRDCYAVDSRCCRELAEHWQARRAREAAAWAWADGMTYVGSATTVRRHRGA